MKNVLKTVLALALAGLMILSLVSCDKSSAVKKAFEKEGYTVKTVDSNNETVKSLLAGVLDEDQMKELSEYELILCAPESLLDVANYALVIKFGNSTKLKDFLTTENDSGEKDTSAYAEAKKNETINGNCLLITAGSSAKEIFKKA